MSNNNGMDLATGITLGLNGLKTVLNPLMASHQNRANLRNAMRIADYNMQLQRSYAHDAPAIQMQALKDAGISPAMLNQGGMSPASTNVQASTPQGVAPQIDTIDPLTVSQMMLNRKQSKILDENKRAAAANADLAETNAQQADWRFTQEKVHDIALGQQLDKMGITSTDSTNSGPANDATFKVLSGLTLQEYETQMMEQKRNHDVAMLEQNVANMKASNKDVLSALTNMDVQTYNNLVENGKKLLNDNKLFNATYQYMVDKSRFERLIAEGNYKALGIDINRAELAYAIESALKPIELANAKNAQKVDIKTYLAKLQDGDFGFKDSMMLLVSVLAMALTSGAGSFGGSIGSRIGSVSK